MSIVSLVVLTAVTAPFALAVWAAFLHAKLTRGQPNPADISDRTPSVDFAPSEAESLDVASILREAADALAPLARDHFVRIAIAVSPGLSIRTDRHTLNMVAREMIEIAIRAAPGGQMLVTALPLGTQLHIRIADEGAGTDQQLRESMTRGAAELIALRGGTIAVEARPGRGTTMSVRLPLPAGEMPVSARDSTTMDWRDEVAQREAAV
jgi:signal transduction histidine kinase